MFTKIACFCSLILFLLMISPVDKIHSATILKMSHQFPADTIGSKIDQWFCDQIKSATGGEIEIKIFWLNRLGNPQEILELLKTGIIDMAAISPGYFSSEMPLFAAPNSIPMSMDNICQASQIMKAFMDKIPAFAKEASENHVQPLFFHVLNPYLLVTKQSITRFADLEGKRIRIWGNDMPRLIQAAKAKPVSLFLPDIYDAMKMGVIDGCPFSVDLVVSYKIYEIARHITEVVLWEGPAWGIWVSEKTWQKLSPSVRNIFVETAEKARLRDIESTVMAEKKARAFLLDNGVQFHSFPEEELSRWKNENPDFFSDFIRQMTEKGKGDAAQQMVDMWQKMRAEIKCQ
ncbi:MAG: TRAP transporter substrate-binding protein DctP [Desulfamplus sp.]|nr:TRAP transporter substrate-binding protein DctP [Desulfamplus sp.]